MDTAPFLDNLEQNGAVGYRTSPQQRRLLQQCGDGPPFLTQALIELAGDVDHAELATTIAALCKRHEILRTDFCRASSVSDPVQVIRDEARIAWTTGDLGDRLPDDLDAAVDALMERERGRSFALDRDPHMRLAICRLGTSHLGLVLTIPTIRCDAASMRLLTRQIAETCGDSARHGEDLGSGPQYADLSEALNQLLESEETARGRQLWRELGFSSGSDGAEGDKNLGSPAPPFRPAVVWSRLPHIISEALGAQSDALQVPVSSLVEAAWLATVWRLRDAEPTSVGLCCECRNHAEITNAVGVFAKHLPLCVDPKSRTFAEFAKSLHLQRMRGEALSEYCDPGECAESSGHAAAHCFDCIYAYHDIAEAYAGQRLTARLRRLGSCLDRHELALTCLRRSDGYLLVLEYNGASRARHGAEEVLGCFLRYLAAAIRRPVGRLLELPLLESRQEQWQRHHRAYSPGPASREQTLHGLFEAQVARSSQAVAIRFGETSLTYAELDGRAKTLAAVLAARGIGPEDRVAIWLNRSPQLLVSILAVLKCGAAYVPLDPSHDPRYFARILADCGAGSAIGVPVGARALCPPHLDIIDPDDPIDMRHPKGTCQTAVRPANLAYVIYTSGSTGRPKGVMVSHGAIASYLSWCRRVYLSGEGEDALLHSSIGFDFSITPLFLPLIAGRAVTLLPEGNAIMEVVDRLRSSRRVALLKLTPSHLRLVERLLREEPESRAVDTLIVGGEALMAEDLEKWRRLAPATQIVNEYGPTETTVGCSAHFVREADDRTGPVAIGRPIDRTHFHVLDQGMNPVPVGVAGELYVGGAGLARGYLAMPSITADRFVPDPFSDDGARLYRTGDRVRRKADGSLVFEGRFDDQFKIRGVRVEPGEVKAALETHEAVETALPVGVETGSAERALVAYLVAKDGLLSRGGRLPSNEELVGFLKERLPAALVPTFFVWLPELPLSRNDKIDLRRLPKPFRADVAAHREAPRSETEEILAGIWGRILRLNHLSVADNYFAIGGDSIRAIEIAAQARQRGISVSVADVFAHPTVRALAEFAERSPVAPEGAGALGAFALISEVDRRRLPPGVEDAYPLTRLQAGMIFHQALDPGAAVYHDIFSYRIAMPVDLEAMRICAADLVARHPALRTSFDMHRYSEPLQIVQRDGEPVFSVEDLSHLSACEQNAGVSKWIEEEKSRGFSIATAPLVRLHVHKRSDSSVQLTLSFHHAILDGWSDAIILSELFEHYFALLEASNLTPAAPVLHFREYLALERAAQLDERSRRYWHALLSDYPPLRLPRRLDRPEDGRRSRVEAVEVDIPAHVSDGIHAVAVSLAVPIKCVLLAAHLRVLSLLSGRTDVVTCIVASARPERADGARAVGLFINTLPFRLQLVGGTWRQLIATVFAGEREALPHRTYPLSAMPRGETGRPSSDALFYFTHYHIFEALDRHPNIEVLDTISHEVTSFPLVANFSLAPRTRRLQLRLACDSRFLSGDQAAALAEIYANALATISSDPDGRYETTDLLAAERRARILRGGCGKQTLIAHEGHVAARIAAMAERQPEAMAVECGAHQLTYGELARLGRRLAHCLRRQGVGDGDVVAMRLPRGVAMVVAYLGILQAGGIVLPLEATHPVERLRMIVSDAGARALIVDPAHSSELASFCDTAISLDETWSAIGHSEAAAQAAAPHNETIAYICYTSGSTGRPRGVEVPHRALSNILASMAEEIAISSVDTLVSVTSIAFDIAALELLLPLTTGAKLVIARSSQDLAPQRLVETLREHGATVMQATPGVWQMLVDSGWSPPAAMRVLCGGEAMTAELGRALTRNGAQVWNLYGPTETTIWSSARRLPVPCTEVDLGSPVHGTRVYLLDPHLQLVPNVFAGEIFISGVGLARSYLGQPRPTAERFLPDPYAPDPGARMYRTGDIARRTVDGRLEFLGRKDAQIKLRGYRIELGEIEVALRRLPEVSNAAVVVDEGEPDSRAIIAYVTASTGDAVDREALSKSLRLVLPDYMIPARLVVLDRFPLTSNGKIDHRTLPPPSEVTRSPSPELCSPQSALTRVLVAILGDLLRRDDISATDNVLSLGLDSLRAVRFQALLRELLGADVPLRELFGDATIARIEAFLRRAGPSPAHFEQKARLLIDVSELSEHQIQLQLEGEKGSP